jgi:hypothetical protein
MESMIAAGPDQNCESNIVQAATLEGWGVAATQKLGSESHYTVGLPRQNRQFVCLFDGMLLPIIVSQHHSTSSSHKHEQQQTQRLVS